MTATKWHFEHSVECDASVSAAWAFWTDVANWELLEGEAVEYVTLAGPFEAGVQGQTKTRGQPAMNWQIANVEFERSATIEMPVSDVLFFTRMTFASLASDRTRITQRMWLEGDVPPEVLAGITTFEESAPQGLAKLATAIIEAQRP